MFATESLIDVIGVLLYTPPPRTLLEATTGQALGIDSTVHMQKIALEQI